MSCLLADLSCAEGVLCKWADGQLWPDKGFGQKRLIACLAVFAVTHGIGGSTIFSGAMPPPELPNQPSGLGCDNADCVQCLLQRSV